MTVPEESKNESASERKVKLERDFIDRVNNLSIGEQVALKRSLGMSMADVISKRAVMAFRKAFWGGEKEDNPRELVHFICACAHCNMKRLEGNAVEFATGLRILSKRIESNTIERKLANLIDTPILGKDDTYFAKQCGSLLRHLYTQEIKIDCALLLADLKYWNCADGRIQDKWASEFYKYSNKKDDKDADRDKHD